MKSITGIIDAPSSSASASAEGLLADVVDVDHGEVGLQGLLGRGEVPRGLGEPGIGDLDLNLAVALEEGHLDHLVDERAVDGGGRRALASAVRAPAAVDALAPGADRVRAHTMAAAGATHQAGQQRGLAPGRTDATRDVGRLELVEGDDEGMGVGVAVLAVARLADVGAIADDGLDRPAGPVLTAARSDALAFGPACEFGPGCAAGPFAEQPPDDPGLALDDLKRRALVDLSVLAEGLSVAERSMGVAAVRDRRLRRVREAVAGLLPLHPGDPDELFT